MLQYTYTPLDTSRPQIRLFHLRPGKRDEPLHVDLFTALLDEEPQFYALSYVWGDPAARCNLYINECQFSVTANLATALKLLRDEKMSITVWADAICIDQSNIPERNHQVAQMRSLYRSAKRVYACLGEVSGNSNFALDFIKDVHTTGVQVLRQAMLAGRPEESQIYRAMQDLFARP